MFAFDTEDKKDHREAVKKQGFSADDARRRREEYSVSIRKADREESLKKRRQATIQDSNQQIELRHKVRTDFFRMSFLVSVVSMFFNTMSDERVFRWYSVPKYGRRRSGC
jgi:hypothetical protein